MGGKICSPSLSHKWKRGQNSVASSAVLNAASGGEFDPDRLIKQLGGEQIYRDEGGLLILFGMIGLLVLRWSV